jgi:hypothetical protein
MIIFTTIFLALIIATNLFKNKIFKIFLVLYIFFLLAYLFLHAGLGSNRTVGTFGQWNTGYFGIGLLYAFLITAILFTGFLLYWFFTKAYQSHKIYGCWTDIDEENVIDKDK